MTMAGSTYDPTKDLRHELLVNQIDKTIYLDLFINTAAAHGTI